MSACAQLLSSVYDAMHAGKSNALLADDRILAPGAVCFAVIDQRIKVRIIFVDVVIHSVLNTLMAFNFCQD